MAAEGFVGRWSRLKRRAEPSARAQQQHDTLEDPPASPVSPAAAAAATATGSSVPLDATGRSAVQPADQSSAGSTWTGQDVAGGAGPASTRLLPDIESLGTHSDLSMFMSADVDPQLRVRALKKLFADPHFNRMDGLDVYIDDYSKPDPMPLALIRRLAQSRILGLSDEPPPEHAVPGETDATMPDALAVAADEADEAAVSKGAAVADEAVASLGAVDGAPGHAVGGAVGGVTAAAESVPAAKAADAAAGLDRTA
jgi:hypothetical protein